MKIRKIQRVNILLLCLILVLQTCLGVGMGSFVSYGYSERPATVNTSSGTLNVRTGPGTGYDKAGTVAKGTTVTVINEANASDGALWYQIRYKDSSGNTITGYVMSNYIKFAESAPADGNFETYLSNQGFPESYKSYLRQLHTKYPKWIFKAQKTNLDWNTVIENEAIVGRNLVANSSVSSWKSTSTGAYNWDNSTWIGFDGASWVAASEEIIKYYMDPRNFLDENSIFQFSSHAYNQSTQTRDGLTSLVSGSFLSGSYSSRTNTGSAPTTGGSAPTTGNGSNSSGSGSAGSAVPNPGDTNGPGGGSGTTASPGNNAGPGSNPGPNGNTNSSLPAISPVNYTEDNKSQPSASISRHELDTLTSSGPGGSSYGGSDNYVDVIMRAGAQSGVNPYVIAAMLIQEQGNNGTGRSISGKEPGYEGYYNYFNIEAYQSGTMDAVTRGLWYASQSGSYERPWNSVEKSILGGSIYYGNNYVNAGQDTFYLKKYNVQGDNIYKHQYMTNVQGAASEGVKLAKAYSTVKDTALEFKIPVYNNMPDAPAVKPTGDGSPNNKLKSIGITGFSLTPTFNADTLEYDVIVNSSVSSVTISAAAMSSSATVTGTGTINLNSGNNTVTIAVKAQNGTIRNYVINIARQSNGPNSSGGSPGPGGGGSGPGSSGGSSGPGGSGGGSGSGTSPGSGTAAGKYTINANVVSGIMPSTKVADFITNFQSKASVKVYKSNGTENTGNIGTGDSIQLDGSSGTKYTAQVLGDNNGDGVVGIVDVLQAQRHILGLSSLEGVYLNASDVNKNGKLDLMDILKMQRDILGIEKITQ